MAEPTSREWIFSHFSEQLVVVPAHAKPTAEANVSYLPVREVATIAEWARPGSRSYLELLRLYETLIGGRLGRAPGPRDLRHMIARFDEAVQSGRLRMYRRRLATTGAGVDTSDGEIVVTAAQRPVSIVQPCDFDEVIFKCKHCPDSDGKRTISNLRFWREGGVNKNNLKKPPAGSKRQPTTRFEVVAGSKPKYADPIEIEVKGGPGYHCDGSHPHITIVDSQNKRIEHEGETKVKLDAVCLQLPTPLSAYANPFALLLYHFFPDRTVNHYSVTVESCGKTQELTRGFGRLQQDIAVYPSDEYKLEISIPSFKKRSYSREKAKSGDARIDATESRTERGWSGQAEGSTSKETSSSSKLERESSYSIQNRSGGLSETNQESLDEAGNYSRSSKLSSESPIDHPVRNLAASVKLTCNGSDVEGSATLGELINAIVNIQNEIQSVMNFIKDFQPQVGWKFSFEMELFKGDLSYEWGYKEWEDHSVYRWWKFSIGMTIIKVELELSFGASLKVAGVGVTAVIFGKTAMELKVSASKESNPDKPEPWELKLEGKPEGEIGIRAALGADWVKAEGKLTCGFPFEAVCKADTSQPFHIDWSLSFTGVDAVVEAQLKFVGKVSKKWTVVQPRKDWKKGRFPGGDKEQKGLRKPGGTV